MDGGVRLRLTVVSTFFKFWTNEPLDGTIINNSRGLSEAAARKVADVAGRVPLVR